jgi:hypothetical protein
MTVFRITALLLTSLVCCNSFAPRSGSVGKPYNGIVTTRRVPFHLAGLPTETETPTAADPSTDVDLCTIEGSFCDPEDVPINAKEQEILSTEGGFSYGDFARNYPFANNIGIATCKTAAADLLAQTVIAQTPVSDIDWQRSLLFCAFGAIYLGGFQYLYQVQVFKRLFDVDSFTSQPWADKLRDGPGLRALGAQTALDLGVLTLVYLPTFYIFKAGVFSGSLDPAVWASTGLESYTSNFAKDEFDLIRVWLPADLVCFSVPLYLRLPVRHIVSFVWTAYLSFARGGH